MTDSVPASEIEAIVGETRHEVLHVGRAVSSEQTVYILHSRLCLASYLDLNECPFSRALDLGIDISQWTEDVPLVLTVADGHLMPSSAVTLTHLQEES